MKRGMYRSCNRASRDDLARWSRDLSRFLRSSTEPREGQGPLTRAYPLMFPVSEALNIVAMVSSVASLIGDETIATMLSASRSEEHTSELQSRQYLVCRLLLEKKKKKHEKHLVIVQLTNATI